jgi:hypothetical protein
MIYEFVSVNFNALSFVIFQVWIHSQIIEVKNAAFIEGKSLHNKY